jgi:hypothetical protein
MNPQIFNVCVLIGWLMVVLGIALVSIPLALLFGGLLMLGCTFGMAWFFGVVKPKRRAPPEKTATETLFKPADPENE